MPSFSTLARWEQFVPSIANNREEQKPFFLRVHAGLTRPEYDAFREKERAFWARLADEEIDPALAGQPGCAAELLDNAVTGVVELGSEPMTINGTAITAMRQLADLFVLQRGYELAMEMLGAVAWHNSFNGAKELFSARLSGGRAFTPTGAPKTAAP